MIYSSTASSKRGKESLRNVIVWLEMIGVFGLLSDAAGAQPTFAGPGRHLKERLKKQKKKSVKNRNDIQIPPKV